MLCCVGVCPPGGESAEGLAEGLSVQGLRENVGIHLALHNSVSEDRLRLRQLLCDSPTAGFLLRSPSSMNRTRSGNSGESTGHEAELDGFRWSPVAPELHTVHNSGLPFSLNEGALWAGRGLSTRVSAGARLEFGSVTLVLAPQLIHERNRDFQTFSNPESGGRRHPLASPFHFSPGSPGSMDLPQRFGTGPRTILDAGQSSITYRRGALAAGMATENLWWGPGIRNGLLMSSNAPGIPHLFLRTAEPLETRIGTWEGHWMLGRLSESDYFDFDDTNNYRSLNALAVVFSPAFDTGLSVGVARAVYAPAEGSGVPLGAALDVFRIVGRPGAAPGDDLVEPAPDQILSLFARWIFPGNGFEVWGEWARHEQPASLRGFLELPNHSRGYTVGLQWARPIVPSVALRIQTEITNLEPSTSYRVRRSGEWYASRAVPEGYTHRGRVIGAAIGPSGSSQWVAGDVVGGNWSLGTFAGRIRWENEARYSYPPEFRRSDFTVFAGVRGSTEVGPMAVAAEYVLASRLNYLFQARSISGFEDRGVDVRNHTVKVTFSTGHSNW